MEPGEICLIYRFPLVVWKGRPFLIFSCVKEQRIGLSGNIELPDNYRQELSDIHLNEL